jgi:hypothetical protein
LPGSGDLDLTSSEDEDVDSAPHDCTYSNARMRKATRNRSDVLLEQLKVVGRRWSSLRDRFAHRETKQHGAWVWRTLIYKPVWTCLSRMKTAAKQHYRKERVPKKTHLSPDVPSASVPSKKANALFPSRSKGKRNAGTSKPTKPYMGRHPSKYCEVAEQVINNMSKVIHYGCRVVDEVTPEEKAER